MQILNTGEQRQHEDFRTGRKCSTHASVSTNTMLEELMFSRLYASTCDYVGRTVCDDIKLFPLFSFKNNVVSSLHKI